MYPRILNPLKSSTFFLFGARSTGKSTLISMLFKESEAILIDLLDTKMLARLQARPEELVDILAAIDANSWCIIDEVQKIPAILDIVHSLIEETKRKFVLTGSSARKLKRSAANMLGGRAFLYKLFPLTHVEFGQDFRLEDVLNFGSLAKITEYRESRERISFLRSYVETYLKEEILVEQLIRNLPPFRRFLEVAAAGNTEIINYQNIARDVLSDPKNIANYYTILEDTLLGFFLEPYATSVRKRQRQSPKFYFFDTGVVRTLAGTVDIPIQPKSYEYGTLFESFIVNEIYRLLTYSERSFKLSYLRVDDKLEIDLVLERAGMPTYLIEIKSTEFVNDKHTHSLELYHKEFPDCVPLVFSQDRMSKVINGIKCIHWQEGIRELGIVMPE